MAKHVIELKKIAVFVEGLTEQLFVTKLFEEILTKSKLAVVTKKITGGGRSNAKINISTLEAEIPNDTTEYYILIVDCSGDSKVKSYILDQRESLIKSGYSSILGFLDLYPKPKSDLHKSYYGLFFKVPQTLIPIEFVISVMEIEAWFIGESSHFEKIDVRLTEQYIQQNIGYNPANVNVENIAHPAEDMDKIFQLVGRRYLKKKTSLQNTINTIDFGEIYLELPAKISSLNTFISIINKLID